MESRKSFRILKFKKSKPILKISGISKSYGHRLVLKKINFELHKSEIFGVLGPNGCGKTTIFNSIMGICRINEGNIFVNNIKVNNLPIHERATKFRIGYIPQNSAVFLGLTCEENIRAIAEVKIKEKSLQENKIQELLSAFNLEYLKNIKAINLSGGEKKTTLYFNGPCKQPTNTFNGRTFCGIRFNYYRYDKKNNFRFTKKINISNSY